MDLQLCNYHGGLHFEGSAQCVVSGAAPTLGRGVPQVRPRNLVGQHFWARGFFVNTVGRDEEANVRNQEQEDQRLEQTNLWR